MSKYVRVSEALEIARQDRRVKGAPDRYFLRWSTHHHVVGERLGPSRRWIDGDPTDERLEGTSALRINAKYSPLDLDSMYEGDVYLIRGEVLRRGEDRGEVLLDRPRVVACLARMR